LITVEASTEENWTLHGTGRGHSASFSAFFDPTFIFSVCIQSCQM